MISTPPFVPPQIFPPKKIKPPLYQGAAWHSLILTYASAGASDAAAAAAAALLALASFRAMFFN